MIKTGAQKWNIGEDVFAQDLNDTFDEVIPKTYSDGNVGQQITDDADVNFGQNDATSKRLKIAQQIKILKNSMASVAIKKGASTTSQTSASSDATCSTPTYSEVDTNTAWTDGGVISSSYRRLINNGSYWYGNDYGRLTKTVTTTPGVQHTLNVDIAGNFGTNSSPLASQICVINVDGVRLLNVTSGTAGTFSTKTLNWTPAGTSSVITMQVQNYDALNGTYNYNQSPSIPQNYDFKNFSVTYPAYNSGDVTIKLYADNAGSPSSTLLGTATITNSIWFNTSNNAEVIANFSSPITGLSQFGLYWIIIESTAPNASSYFALRKKGSNVYADGVAKYFNTADGWVSETGDLYFRVIQNTVSVFPQTGDDGKIPLQFIGQPIYGDASDGSATLSGTVNIARDMFYDVLTIQSGAIVNTNGYRLFGNELINNGTIQNNGANASGNSAGAGGVGGGAGGIGFRNSYYWDYAGGGGGGGGVVALFFKKITVGGNINAIGGNGGVGAINQGGSGANSGNASGNGGNIDCTFIKTGTGGKGGGGASNGGTITTSQMLTFIFTNIVNMFDFVLSKTIKGGAGGGGGQGSTVNSTADGGGGGQGGLIILLYSILISDATYNVSGGTGGAAVGAGNAGSNGSAGRVLKIKA